jgi:hypothetical protein
MWGCGALCFLASGGQRSHQTAFAAGCVLGMQNVLAGSFVKRAVSYFGSCFRFI